MDVSADGRADFVCFKNSTTFLSRRYSTSHPLIITAVQDGMGNQYHYSFGKLTDSDIYSSTLSSTSNELPYVWPLYVVTGYTAPYTSVSYIYKNGILHKHGKGFLGFMETEQTDNLNNRKTLSKKEKNSSFYGLLPLTSTVMSLSGDTLLHTAHLNNYHSSGNHVYYPYYLRSVSRDYLTTLCDTVSQFFDAYGNVTSRTSTRGNLKEYFIGTYGNVASWCTNKIVRKETFSTLNDEMSVLRTIHYSYNAVGLPDRCVEDSSMYGKKLVHRYTYDSFGNVTDETVTDGTQTRTTSTVWAASGRYPLSSTDELGMTTTYTYNDTTGLLRSSVGAVGTTAYTYDAFGRPMQTTYPDGVVATVSREYITGAGSVRYAVTETRTKSPVQTTYYNSSGMPLFTKSVGFASRQTYTACGYNTDGSKQYVSEPFYASSLSDAASRTFTEADATLYTYDAYGRTKTVRSPAGNSTYGYGGLTTDVTTNEGTFGSTMNSAGFVITRTIHDDGFSVEPDLPIEPPRSHVDNSRRIHYTYYPTGQVKTITPDGSAAITLQYDGKGNRTSMADPDAGTVTDTYNAFGQVMTHSQPVHSGTSTTTYTYSSSSGQLLSETTVGSTTLTKTYTYHTTFKDLPVKIAYSATDYVAYTYDAKGRQTGCTRLKDGETVTDTYTYGTGSLVSQHNHNGKTLETFTYDTYGNQTAEGLTPYATTWQLLDVNARGQVLREQKGSVVTTYTYDNAGRMLSMKAPNIVNLTYAYDGAGNLLSKTDSITGQTVTYGYDGKNRLTSWRVERLSLVIPPLLNEPRDHPSLIVDSTFTMTYDETTGNIIAKSDLGADAVLGYGETTAPHALDLVSGVATDWGTDAVAIGYTDFGKVSSITEGDWAYTIAYSPDGVRAKSSLSDGQGGYTMRHYGDGTEKTRSNGNNLDYLSYLCHGAIVVHHGTGRSPLPPTPTAVLQGYYDAQGSLIALVDANGSVVRRYAYDPWGRRVNPNSWAQADTTHTDVYHINRGYTMHEHLREFGLINMNGRVFDPAVAQFLSPDNYIQADGNWLNYNRYAYCLNNPLKYTDPSGEIVWEAVLLGAYVCGVVNMMTNSAAIMNSQNTCLTALGYFGIGALAGAAGGIAGGAVAGGMMYGGFVGGIASGTAGGAASGFILGAGNAWMGGANFGNGLLAGCKSAAIGAASGALLGGLSEGLMAKSEGYSFWNGSGEPIPFDTSNLMDEEVHIPLKPQKAMDNDLIKKMDDFGYDLDAIKGYGVRKITTRASRGVKHHANGKFVYQKKLVGGYCVPFDKGLTDLHISSWATYSKIPLNFQAVVEHELLHACHHYSSFLVGQKIVWDLSEYVAYNHTASLYEGVNSYIYNYMMDQAKSYLSNATQSIPNWYGNWLYYFK